MVAGDLRLFQILWLTVVERRRFANHWKEPIPRIGPLSAPLEALAELLGVDRDLVRTAGEPPADCDSDGSFPDETHKTFASIPDDGKTLLLLCLASGDPHMATEIRIKIRVGCDSTEGQVRVRRRTVAEIRKRGLSVREERRAEQARRREAEQLHKAQEADRAQRMRLKGIRHRGVRVWNDVEMEAARSSAGSYGPDPRLARRPASASKRDRHGGRFREAG